MCRNSFGFIDPLSLATAAIAAITIIGTLLATQVVQQPTEDRTNAAYIDFPCKECSGTKCVNTNMPGCYSGLNECSCASGSNCAACGYVPPDPTSPPSQCRSGATEKQNCNNSDPLTGDLCPGERKRTCTNNNVWGSWGACTDIPNDNCPIPTRPPTLPTPTQIPTSTPIPPECSPQNGFRCTGANSATLEKCNYVYDSTLHTNVWSWTYYKTCPAGYCSISGSCLPTATTIPTPTPGRSCGNTKDDDFACACFSGSDCCRQCVDGEFISADISECAKDSSLLCGKSPTNPPMATPTPTATPAPTTSTSPPAILSLAPSSLSTCNYPGQICTSDPIVESCNTATNLTGTRSCYFKQCSGALKCDQNKSCSPCLANSTPITQPTINPCVQAGGSCYWGSSSCTTFGRTSVNASCTDTASAPVACCGNALTQNQCTQGQSFCLNNNQIKVCKADQSGYTDPIPCAANYSCSPGDRFCQPISSPNPSPAAALFLPDSKLNANSGATQIATLVDQVSSIIKACQQKNSYPLGDCFCQKLTTGCPTNSIAAQIAKNIDLSTQLVDNTNRSNLECVEYACAVASALSTNAPCAISGSAVQVSNSGQMNSCVRNENFVSFKPGDYVFFPASPLNPDGHIGICIEVTSADGQTCRLAEANYSTIDGQCQSGIGCIDNQRRITSSNIDKVKRAGNCL